jgi:hypothetical protein
VTVTVYVTVVRGRGAWTVCVVRASRAWRDHD